MNVTFGVAVPASAIVTPWLMLPPAFFASDQSPESPAVTPVPPIASGTSITSPAPSGRDRLTVNDALSPASTDPESVRASDTTVASASAIVTSTWDGEPNRYHQ